MPWMVLPPNPGDCQVCAFDHEPDLPHNRLSLFYQFTFYQEHGRVPTWEDAWAHCSAETQAVWKVALIARQIAIDEECGVDREETKTVQEKEHPESL